MASLGSSLRYLFADIIGDNNSTSPVTPERLPEGAASAASAAVAMLMEYQGSFYAQLYLDRLQRFTDRRGVDGAMLADIATLMAARMSYQDPIRIAQLKLAELNAGDGVRKADEVRKFRLDELIGALPAIVAEPLLDILEWLDWLHKPVSIRFSTASRWGVRRLKIESFLRRWRLFSVRYGKEMMWVERWLHMIDRCLTKQPASAPEVVRTASMIEGYGDVYRQGLADWHAIIDGLAKPTFDGTLPLPSLAAAIVQARAASEPDPRQAALKRKIAGIRANALDAEKALSVDS